MSETHHQQPEPIDDPVLNEVDRLIAESVRSETVPEGLVDRLYQGSVSRLGADREVSRDADVQPLHLVSTADSAGRTHVDSDRRQKLTAFRWNDRQWSMAAIVLLAVTVSIVMLVMNRWGNQPEDAPPDQSNGRLADGTQPSEVIEQPDDLAQHDSTLDSSDLFYQDTLALDLSLLEDRIDRVGQELIGLDGGYGDWSSWETTVGSESTWSLDQTAASIDTRIDLF